ncbi:2TM domain-containing protein [Mesonia ostreae]|uniref:2TM domain-containing protein n=1 Tax=Mesonia ostreae TaxID=861110 RepID=A0ABU2KLS3_9FLAO|nr:2TM domain-containing protein [Mesonia ostreae]MDT0295668.1 2TM domain-containing protein [Mesonia ostreae]
MSPRHLKILFRISIGVTLIILLLEFFFAGLDYTIWFDGKKIGIQFLYCFVITLFNFVYFVWLEKKYDWHSESKKRFIIGVVGSTFVSLFAFGICRIIHLVWIEQSMLFSEFLQNETPSRYLFPFLLSVIVSLFLHAAYFYKVIQENRVTEQKLIAGTASAKFDALKNQLDPHFLFNSLNVLTSLIEENPNAAQDFTTSLSKVYRYVLEQKNKELVAVEEELQFAKRYIGLLKMRFEDSIQFHIPDNLLQPEAKIVPLSLQLLLENAVKHNVVSPNQPLEIVITEEKEFLVIKNNLRKKNILGKSSGFGLQNIQQRYALLTSRKMLIQQDKTTFTVKLPMLTKQISIIKESIKTDEDMTKREKLERAQERVKAEKAFFGNLTAYCIVIPFLFFVNWMSNGLGTPWFLFAAIGWGIGLFFHYIEAFDHNPFFGKDWEQRKIKQLMEEDDFNN